MKTSLIPLYVLVSLCLVFSLTALTIVTLPSDFWSTLTSGSKPQVTYTPSMGTSSSSRSGVADNAIKFSYSDKDSRIFTVAIEYLGSEDVTIEYSDFYLSLSASRFLFDMYYGSASPVNNGTVTLGPGHSYEVIELIFEFDHTYFNGMDEVLVNYKLGLNP